MIISGNSLWCVRRMEVRMVINRSNEASGNEGNVYDGKDVENDYYDTNED
jgi:hypothetical protein